MAIPAPQTTRQAIHSPTSFSQVLLARNANLAAGFIVLTPSIRTPLSKAAEQGDGHAQANLAAVYQAGCEVHRDLVQAYKWYQLSQKNGRTDWSHQLRELANMMTSDEIAETERMASKSRPHKGSSAEGEGDCWNERHQTAPLWN